MFDLVHATGNPQSPPTSTCVEGGRITETRRLSTPLGNLNAQRLSQCPAREPPEPSDASGLEAWITKAPPGTAGHAPTFQRLSGGAGVWGGPARSTVSRAHLGVLFLPAFSLFVTFKNVDSSLHMNCFLCRVVSLCLTC